MKRLLILILVLCNLALLPISFVNAQNTLLWEISGNEIIAPCYLYGTFHLMCKDDIQISDSVLKAIDNTTSIYLEMDMDDPNMMMGMLNYVNLKNGKTLPDLYDNRSDYERLERFFQDSLQISLQQLKKMKPSVIVAMLYPKLMPCNRIGGVEEELVAIGKSKQKTIHGLETLAFQASLFDQLSEESEAKKLLEAVDSFSTYKQKMMQLISIYKNQQLDQMEKAMREEDGFADSKDILLSSRNKNWVAQLKSIWNKEAVLVAVGAGHLVGDEGLISLFKKEGYQVRAVIH